MGNNLHNLACNSGNILLILNILASLNLDFVDQNTITKQIIYPFYGIKQG